MGYTMGEGMQGWGGGEGADGAKRLASSVWRDGACLWCGGRVVGVWWGAETPCMHAVHARSGGVWGYRVVV